jgi:hypothetical protein
MEKRVVLAVVLTIAVIFLTNILFPPAPVSNVGGPETSDSIARESPDAGERAAETGGAAVRDGAVGRQAEGALSAGDPTRLPGAVQQIEHDTIVVSSDLYELRFSTLGARMVGARLLGYESYAERSNGDDRVQLIRPGDGVLGYRCLLYTSPSPRDRQKSRMPSSA